MTFVAGQLLQGRYVVVRPVGSGGFGHVYEIQDLLTDTRLAMKVGRSRVRSRDLQREVVLLSSLPAHPNVCGYLYSRTIAGLPCIFMPLAPHGSMRNWLGRIYRRRDLLVRFALGTAQGIRQVHTVGFAHGDVKPDNVLVMADTTAAVSDFGLSVTARTTALGRGFTRAYRAPEAVSGDIAPSADVYAWALCLLEAIHGARFWDDGARAVEEARRWLREQAADVRSWSAPLVEVVVADPVERREAFDGACATFRMLHEKHFGSAPTEAALKVLPDEGAPRTTSFQRVDLAGGAWGPEVLLLKARVAAVGTTADRLNAIAERQDAGEVGAPGRLASEVLCLGDIIDAVIDDDRLAGIQAAAWSELGLAYMAMGDHAAAADAHAAAVRLAAQEPLPAGITAEHHVGFALRLAEAHALAGRSRDELAVLEAIPPDRVELAGADAELRIRIANAKTDMGDVAGAEEVYSALIGDLPETNPHLLARLLHERGVNRRRGHDLAGSESDLRRSVALTWELLDRLVQVVKEDAERDEVGDADRTLAAGVWLPNLLTQLANTAGQLARTLGDAGSIDEADRYYHLAEQALASTETVSAVDRDSKMASNAMSRGLNLATAGRLGEAEAAVAAAVSERRRLVAEGDSQSVPGLANALVNLSSMRIQREDFAGAVEAAAECIQICTPLTETEMRDDLWEIALRCMALILDAATRWGHDLTRSLTPDAIKIADRAIARAVDLGAEAESARLLDIRARMKANLATQVKSAEGIALLEEATEDFRQAGESGLPGAERWTVLTLVKLGATLASLNELDEAARVGAHAVERAEAARRATPGDANLAVATAVAICMATGVSEMAGRPMPSPSPSPLVAVGDLIRNVQVEALDGVSRIDAAYSLLRLGVDEAGDLANYVADGLFAVDLLVGQCVREPSDRGLEALAMIAQVAMTRCARAGDAAGTRRIQSSVVEVEVAMRAGAASRYQQFFADLRLRLASMASAVERPGQES